MQVNTHRLVSHQLLVRGFPEKLLSFSLIMPENSHVIQESALTLINFDVFAFEINFIHWITRFPVENLGVYFKFHVSIPFSSTL